jgi:hypothetical protein
MKEPDSICVMYPQFSDLSIQIKKKKDLSMKEGCLFVLYGFGSMAFGLAVM